MHMFFLEHMFFWGNYEHALYKPAAARLGVNEAHVNQWALAKCKKAAPPNGEEIAPAATGWA